MKMLAIKFSSQLFFYRVFLEVNISLFNTHLRYVPKIFSPRQWQPLVQTKSSSEYFLLDANLNALLFFLLFKLQNFNMR